MTKLSLQLQTITPMFLSGADGQTPELRAASVRGCLHFWLRALLGTQCGASLEQLHQLESAVLGDTGTASSVILRIRAPTETLSTASTRVLPHSTEKTFSQPAFKADNQFALTLSPRLGQSELPESTVPATLLLLYLGGIGKRSRRGFGSLKLAGYQGDIQTLDRPTQIMLGFRPDSGDTLADYLAKMLRWATASTASIANAELRPYSRNNLPEYPVFSPHHAKVLVCKAPFSSNNYLEAMEKFWQLLRSNRFRDERAYGFVERGERRASPLSVHIHKTPQGHHLVLTAFRSLPSPAGPAGWTRLQELLEECRRQWQGDYVFGGGTTW